jgi:hypothetical protein
MNGTNPTENPMKRTTLAIALACLLAPALAHAQQVPHQMTVQGVVYDAAGAPVTAATSFVFSLTRGGTVAWTETQSITPSNGLFTATLGSNTPIDPAIFTTGPVTMSLTIGSDTLDPIPLTAVPYAFRAQTAASADAYSGDDEWGQVTGAPAGFSDGVDDVGPMYGAGAGLSLTGTTFSTDFGGTGSAVTSARSDHTQDWTTITGVPAGFADGIDDTGGVPTWASIIGIPAGFADGTDDVGGPPAWSSITGVPAGFADGNDANDQSVLQTQTVTSAADVVFSFAAGTDGDTYRRLRVELDGVLAVGARSRVITVNVGGGAYSFAAWHWFGHRPGTDYLHGVSLTPEGIPGANSNGIELCASDFNMDGHISCTLEMSSRSGTTRIGSTHSVFVSNAACGSSAGQPCTMVGDGASSWLDQSTHITSVRVQFDGATLFNGSVTLIAER